MERNPDFAPDRSGPRAAPAGDGHAGARCIGVAAGQVTSYGAVVSRTPIYGRPGAERDPAIDRVDASPAPASREIRLLGFDVVFDYRGRRFRERMRSNPGNRIPIAQDPGAAD